jgi:hypothetical protein
VRYQIGIAFDDYVALDDPRRHEARPRRPRASFAPGWPASWRSAHVAEAQDGLDRATKVSSNV